jgi:hypothetical protein
VKILSVIALLAICAASASVDAGEGVNFDVTVLRSGKVVASPRIVGAFDKSMSVEVSQTMRFEALATSPNADGHSLIAMKLSIFENGAMSEPREMTMFADLSKAPSLEGGVPGTDVRYVVMPRRVDLPN